MSKWIETLRSEEDGSVAAEYGLLITLIAIVMAVGAAILGGQIRDLLSNVF